MASENNTFKVYVVKSSAKWYVAGSLSNVVALFDALFTCVISKMSDVF